MPVILQPDINPSFIDKPVSDYDLQRLFETVIWAPSPFNSQPWEFVVLRDKENIKKILQAVDETDIPPNLIVVLNNTVRKDPGPNAARLGFISVGAAIANFMFSAKYSNIGFYPVSVKYEKNHLKILQHLNVPGNMVLSCLMAAGYLEKNDREIKPAKGKYYEDNLSRPKEISLPEYSRDDINPFVLIPKRKSYRKKFLRREVDLKHRRLLLESGLSSFMFERTAGVELVLVDDRLRIRKLANLIYDAAYKVHMNSGYLKKMNVWIRYSSEEKIKNADGIFIVFLNVVKGKILKFLMWIIEEIKLFLPLKIFHYKKLSKDYFSGLVAGSPMICVFLLKPDNSKNNLEPEDYINAGVSIQSLLLAATYCNIGAQFLSVLVDSPESRKNIDGFLNVPGDFKGEIIDILRLGYIDPGEKPRILSVSSNIRRPSEKILHKESYT
ncbi:MAG: nitroreductase family protein [bacterium]